MEFINSRTFPFFKRLAYIFCRILFNSVKFLHLDAELSKELKNSVSTPLVEWYQKFPMVEDVFLRGIPSFEQAYNNLNFDANVIYSLEGEVSLYQFLLNLDETSTAENFLYSRHALEFFASCRSATFYSG